MHQVSHRRVPSPIEELASLQSAPEHSNTTSRSTLSTAGNSPHNAGTSGGHGFRSLTATTRTNNRKAVGVVEASSRDESGRGVHQGHSWRYTKAQAPKKVLEARGAIDNFYSQGLSWGQSKMVVLLQQSVLLFDPLDPSCAFAQYSSSTPGQELSPEHYAASTGNGQLPGGPVPTLSAARISSQNDNEVIVADVEGNCAVLMVEPPSSPTPTGGSSRPGTPQSTSLCSQLIVKVRFDSRMPSPVPHTMPGLDYAAASALRVQVSRIGCLDTTPAQPYLLATGNAAGLVRLYNMRQGGSHVAVCRFVEPEGAASDPTYAAFKPRQTPGSPTSCPGSGGDLLADSMDEVATVRFSPSGSMLAAGTNNGIVCVWSLSRTSVAVMLRKLHCGAVRALAWSPTVRGELFSGGGSLDGCIVMSSVTKGSSAVMAFTSAQVIQMELSPDGHNLVTTSGYHRNDLSIPATLTFHKNRKMWDSANTSSTPQVSQTAARNATRQDDADATNDDAIPSSVAGINQTPTSSTESLLEHYPEQETNRFTVNVWSVERLRKHQTGGGVASTSTPFAELDVNEHFSQPAKRSAHFETDTSSGHGNADDISTELSLSASLKGHTARPLCLIRARGGTFVTMAAANDETIRFWPLFETVGDRTSVLAHRRSRPATPTEIPSSDDDDFGPVHQQQQQRSNAFYTTGSGNASGSRATTPAGNATDSPAAMPAPPPHTQMACGSLGDFLLDDAFR